MRTLNKLLALLMLALPLQTLAENSTKIDGYTIHHNALPVTTLSPDIASSYGLVRSKYRGLLNISVIRDVANTTGEPVSADISAYAVNLIGQRKEIALKEVREGTAIYYLGEFPITHLEKLDFYLDVKPEGADRSYKTTLSEEFFID